jgi:hypothetical protein
MSSSRGKHKLSFEEVKAWFVEFQNESDRASAVLAVAYLDVQLEEILKAFSADQKHLAELLAPAQPLGSSAVKRKLCLSLGLISPDEDAELECLGKIRNRFAHEVQGLTFDAPPISDLVANLALPSRVFPRYRSSGRIRFNTSVSFIHLLLCWRLDAAEKSRRAEVPPAHIPLTKLPGPPEDWPRDL